MCGRPLCAGFGSLFGAHECLVAQQADAGAEREQLASLINSALNQILASLYVRSTLLVLVLHYLNILLFFSRHPFQAPGAQITFYYCWHEEIFIVELINSIDNILWQRINKTIAQSVVAIYCAVLHSKQVSAILFIIL